MSFTIYIVRHSLAGQFGDYADDSQRPLTEAGKTRTLAVAQKLAQLGIKFDRILTSPYIRAAQTAQLLHQQFVDATLQEVQALQPGGNFDVLYKQVNTIDRRQSICLVGHQPDLSHIAERLIWGEVRSQLMLKKTGTIRIAAPMMGELLGNCTLRWLFPAKVLLGE